MKIVPQLDTDPRLVAFGQTAVGRATLIAMFAAGLLINRLDSWLETAIVITVLTYLPERRRMLVSIAGLYWLCFHSTWLNWAFLRTIARAQGQRTDWTLKALGSGVLALVFCMLAVFFRYVRVHRMSRVAKRPVLCLIVSYGLALTVSGFLPGGMIRLLVWCTIAMTAPYLWYFAYALKDASAKTPDGTILQFGTLRPFWGGSNVPFAKGAANLRKIEARTSKDLSIFQLKALKLLIWAFLLRMLRAAMSLFVYGSSMGLAIPDLEAAVQRGATLPVHTAWASVIANFAQELLTRTINGAIVISCCRMAGFYALRNTYRPLEARTVAEFWNRYYYYFKELLVEFFFFPVFTRYFKQYRRFRLFAATIAAATVGNMVYHFLRDYEYVAQMGIWRALVGFRVYAFYATVLGMGIAISQLRNLERARPAAEEKWWRRALATAGVLSFFCLLEIFDLEGRSYALGMHLRFFLHLFLIRG